MLARLGVDWGEVLGGVGVFQRVEVEPAVHHAWNRNSEETQNESHHAT